MDSPFIYVSGISESPLLFNDSSTISVDLGIQDSASQIWIKDVRAAFGFNSNPHTLEITQVAEDPIVVDGSKLGNAVTMTIGSLHFAGHISHVDSSISSNGYETKIVCNDDRIKDINQYMIHTPPLLPSGTREDTNIIYVSDTVSDGDLYSRNSPLWLLANYGASYAEIHRAISASPLEVNLPAIGIINNKLGRDSEAYRWSFALTPLFDALMQVFADCGYDIYYDNKTIHLIDRSASIDPDVSFIDSATTTSLRTGNSMTDRPTGYAILGAKKQGGVGTMATDNVEYANLKGISVPTFVPCWNEVEISYHNEHGYVERYYPTDEELQMALKGIEHWVYFKMNEGGPIARGWMESRINPYPYGLEGSLLESALSFGGGRSDVKKVIRNRRSIDANFVVAWYDAVSKHARSYYGKLYSATAPSAFLKNCTLSDKAWAWDDIDNVDMNDALSPFYDNGYLKAFARFPKPIGYGVDGTASPANYNGWNEVGDYAYLPIDIVVNSPTSEGNYLGLPGNRIVVLLPEILVESIDVAGLLGSLSTLESFDSRGASTGSGVIQDNFRLYLTEKDYNNPKTVITPITSITDVFIPVQYNERYKVDNTYGASKVAGEIDDNYAPWTKMNPKNPEPDMATKAEHIVSNTSTDVFYEAEVVGLPEVNFFANFADSNQQPKYSFTSINVSVSTAGLMTQYSAKTQLSELVSMKKIEWSRFKSQLDRIQHLANISRFQTTADLHYERDSIKPEAIGLNNYKTSFGISSNIDDPGEEEEEIEQKSFVKAVIIKQKKQHSVMDPLLPGETVRQEVYRGEDDEGNLWPPSWADVDDFMADAATNDDPYLQTPGSKTEQGWIDGFPEDAEKAGYKRAKDRIYGFAPCNDGYLRKDTPALYHQEDIGGSIFCYFTGGVRLEDARLVKITSAEMDKTGDIYHVDVETLPHPIDPDQTKYQFYKVPFAQNDVAGSQGYAEGQIVPIMHNKIAKGASANDSVDASYGGGTPSTDDGALRPESKHVSQNGDVVGDLFVANSPVVGAVAVVVVTPPDSNGNNGIVAAVNAEENQFGVGGDAVAGEEQESKPVEFIGVPNDSIFTGDYGIMANGMNGNWQVIINKPMFTPFESFGAV